MYPNFQQVFLALSLLLNANCFTQVIKTKDGVPIGELKEIVEGCVATGAQQVMNINNVSFKIEDYCTCMASAVLPNLTGQELQSAMENNSFIDLMMRKDNLEIMMSCGKENITIQDDFTMKNDYKDPKYKDYIIHNCVNEIIQSQDSIPGMTHSIAEDICTCAITKMYDEDYNFGEISEIEDLNSVAFNEIIISCLPDEFVDYDKDFVKNQYIPNDIIGSPKTSTIELKNISGSYKIKLSIEGETRYFLFDTGASDLIIDDKIENELIESGIIKPSSYIGEIKYEMANNETTTAKLVRLDNIKIGDYTINNVVVGIIKNGSLLCGTGLLDKFQKWDFDSKNATLTIYR